jgi:hypothetical protein
MPLAFPLRLFGIVTPVLPQLPIEFEGSWRDHPRSGGRIADKV